MQIDALAEEVTALRTVPPAPPQLSPGLPPLSPGSSLQRMDATVFTAQFHFLDDAADSARSRRLTHVHSPPPPPSGPAIQELESALAAAALAWLRAELGAGPRERDVTAQLDAQGVLLEVTVWPGIAEEVVEAALQELELAAVLCNMGHWCSDADELEALQVSKSAHQTDDHWDWRRIPAPSPPPPSPPNPAPSPEPPVLPLAPPANPGLGCPSSDELCLICPSLDAMATSALSTMLGCPALSNLCRMCAPSTAANGTAADVTLVTQGISGAGSQALTSGVGAGEGFPDAVHVVLLILLILLLAYIFLACLRGDVCFLCAMCGRNKRKKGRDARTQTDETAFMPEPASLPSPAAPVFQDRILAVPLMPQEAQAEPRAATPGSHGQWLDIEVISQGGALASTAPGTSPRPAETEDLSWLSFQLPAETAPSTPAAGPPFRLAMETAPSTANDDPHGLKARMASKLLRQDTDQGGRPSTGFTPSKQGSNLKALHTGSPPTRAIVQV